jgi:hypothetical protein
MKIRLSVISPDSLAQVRSTVDLLSHAVESGNMDAVDISTDKLLVLTAGCHSIEQSEKEWRLFLDGIRSKNPGFQSNYLLPGEVCASIFPTVTATDFVLELPIDGDEGEVDASV